MNTVHTTGADPEFKILCEKLDAHLNSQIGGEKQQNQYDKYNTLEDIHDVILIKDGELAIGCGAFKEYEPKVAEIKRVFVCPEARRHNIGQKIMGELENEAKKQGYTKLILETGKPLVAAQKMYEKIGFSRIKNYGQYEEMTESVCMEKEID